MQAEPLPVNPLASPEFITNPILTPVVLARAEDTKKGHPKPGCPFPS
jgi:hypothetical protein